MARYQIQRRRISKVTIRHAQEALALLFPTVRCTVAPNGSGEIWVKDNAGYGFALTLSAGPAGVGATMRKFTGAPPVTLSGNQSPNMDTLPTADMFEVSATVYRCDEYSQAHKAWYAIDAAGMKGKHPSELGMTSPYIAFGAEVKDNA